MKEQKELIEAALALVDALEEKGWFECREEARLTRAAEAYRKAQKEGRRKAPWKDSEGNELFDGDEVRFPDGETLTLKYRQRDDWGARNSDGVWLPIGFLLTERAVKVSP